MLNPPSPPSPFSYQVPKKNEKQTKKTRKKKKEDILHYKSKEISEVTKPETIEYPTLLTSSTINSYYIYHGLDTAPTPPLLLTRGEKRKGTLFWDKFQNTKKEIPNIQNVRIIIKSSRTK